ncbi:hypothetical protein N7G274_001985 [Stereocaulon virgatum]|uniref:Uncharacterized protein n=1 Tax=Stereocaulon virgatum TaxID=373712 RepID=A0ABR4ALK3_9LECA
MAASIRPLNNDPLHQTMAPSDEANTSTIPPPSAESSTASPAQTLSHPRYQEILAYEDKWIGWDGPVWCKRYGRFENQEDAAIDDGFKLKPKEGHESENCTHPSCTCRTPFQHRSYVADIQRRIEPMVGSLIRLENQVGKLIHHFVKDGEHLLHMPHSVESTKRFDEPSESHENRLQRPLEPTEESLKKLEDRVESLTAQVKGILKDRQEKFEKGRESLVPPSSEKSTHHNGGWGENGDGHEDVKKIDGDLEIVSQ